MIERDLQDGVLTLRLAHGKASAMDVELLEALGAEFEALIHGPDDVRAVILTGTGSIFSAGVDLFRVVDGGAAYVDRFVPLLSTFVRALFTLPYPVVAAVNGHAIAGGGVMTLAADYRLMAGDGGGRIGVPEVLVGVPFPAAPLEVVRYVVPPHRVQALIYTGRTLSPQDALAEGLLDEVVPAASLAARAREVALQMAALPPEVFSLTKNALRANAVARMDEAKAYDRLAHELWAAPETHARIREYMARLRK